MKLLLVGQLAQATGIARMMQSIAKGQSLRHETHILGIDYKNQLLAVEPLKGVVLHKNPSDHELFAESRLTSLIDEICPDILLLYFDPWFLPRFNAPLNKAKHKCLSIGYIPVDGQILQANIIKELQFLNALVFFTQFGDQIVEDTAKKLGLKDRVPFKSTSVIPHGISKDVFFPKYGTLNNYHKRRLEARKKLVPNRQELWDGFWILNANRNQYRKRIDLTLQGFSLFAKDKPKNVRLYLHMERKGTGVDVLKMAGNLGIIDRLIFTSKREEHPSVSSKHLNTIYNACDIGVNTSQGEGWGLVSCEHAATGAPQIVPHHSACAEIWKDAAELLPIVRTTNHNGILGGGEVSPNDVADALERLYTNSKQYEQLLKKGFKKVTDNRYSWGKISEDWNMLFENNISRLKPLV